MQAIKGDLTIAEIISKYQGRKRFFSRCLEQVETLKREDLVQREESELSIRRKTELLKVNRSKLYYQPKSRQNEDKIIDKMLDIYRTGS